MVDEPWFREAEVLLREISILVDERDQLIAALAAANIDLDLADARIRQLEKINASLHIELYETKGKADRKSVGIMAAAAKWLATTAVVALVQAPVTDTYHRFVRVSDQAEKVAVVCDVDVVVRQGAVGNSVDAELTPGTIETALDVPSPTVTAGSFGTDRYGAGTFGGGTGRSRTVSQPPDGEQVKVEGSKAVVHDEANADRPDTGPGPE